MISAQAAEDVGEHLAQRYGHDIDIIAAITVGMFTEANMHSFVEILEAIGFDGTYVERMRILAAVKQIRGLS